MPTYIVFSSERRPRGGGAYFLDWGQPPIGVFTADTPDLACQAAAKASGSVSTLFAVEGYAWGVALMGSAPAALGAEGPNDRLTALLERMEKNDQTTQRLLLEAAERRSGESSDGE